MLFYRSGCHRDGNGAKLVTDRVKNLDRALRARKKKQERGQEGKREESYTVFGALQTTRNPMS